MNVKLVMRLFRPYLVSRLIRNGCAASWQQVAASWFSYWASTLRDSAAGSPSVFTFDMFLFWCCTDETKSEMHSLPAPWKRTHCLCAFFLDTTPYGRCLWGGIADLTTGFTRRHVKPSLRFRPQLASLSGFLLLSTAAWLFPLLHVTFAEDRMSNKMQIVQELRHIYLTLTFHVINKARVCHSDYDHRKCITAVCRMAAGRADVLGKGNWCRWRCGRIFSFRFKFSLFTFRKYRIHSDTF